MLVNGVSVVTLTDRPQSVRHRCVIEGFGGAFCVFMFLFSVGVGVFVIGLSQISSFFLKTAWFQGTVMLIHAIFK